MKSFLAMVAALAAVPAAAHEVWVERDAVGPARIYLGEPGDPVPAAGDPEFPKLQKPQVIGASNPALTRRANHIEAAVTGAGDIRVRDDTVFAPWDGEGGKQGAVFYARAGRSETAAKMDLELVPAAAGADRFTLMFRRKPLPAAKVVVISPERWQKSFETDAAGALAVPELGGGRYLLSASHTEKAPGKVGGQDVASVMHISTLTFVR